MPNKWYKNCNKSIKLQYEHLLWWNFPFLFSAIPICMYFHHKTLILFFLNLSWRPDVLDIFYCYNLHGSSKLRILLPTSLPILSTCLNHLKLFPCINLQNLSCSSDEFFPDPIPSWSFCERKNSGKKWSFLKGITIMFCCSIFYSLIEKCIPFYVGVYMWCGHWFKNNYI